MGSGLRLLQVEAEIDWFADIVRRENCRSFLEIGSKFGESLKRVARAMPKGSKVISVDLPAGTKVWPESRKSLVRIIDQLNASGYDARIIWGDSTSPETIQQVRAAGPFDVIFIDANHTLPYVTKDWENYGPMARIIAFHDIAWKRPEDWNGTYRIDVPGFWDRIKTGYRHDQVKLDPGGQDNGIGVLWRD